MIFQKLAHLSKASRTIAVDNTIDGKSRARDGSCRRSCHARGTLDMPNDAKLGLIVGIGLVIGVAVVFFRKDLGPPEKPGEPSYVTPVSATRAAPSTPRGTYRSAKAKAVTQEDERGGEEATGRGGGENL